MLPNFESLSAVWNAAVRSAPLVRQEIGELEVAAPAVAVPLRKERLPAQAGVDSKAAVPAPILAIVLPLRIRLRKCAHLPQQKVRQAVTGVRGGQP